MTPASCTFRLNSTAIECELCGLVLGESGPRDCPRATASVAAPVTLPAAVKSTGAAGVVAAHRIEERAA